MMSPTIKVNETVNAVKVDSIKHDGIYVLIDEIDGGEVMSVRRFFINLDRSSYQVNHDNPSYPDTEISKETLEKNRLILRVFSIMQTIVKI